MDREERKALILRPPTIEVITESDLDMLLETVARPRHYIGFEISGPLHLGTLLISGLKIRDFMQAGFDCTVFLADWHTYINEKLGGDWERIRRAARYYEEAFKLFVPGVNVVLGSELYASYTEYWREVVRFGMHVSLSRAVRALTIMGRSQRETLAMAQYLYPLMQAVDIHALGVDVAHAGLDQRKAHVLAREVFPRLGWRPPVAVHHALLPGLSEPTVQGLDEDERMDRIVSSKMSKSRPEGLISVLDEPEAIERKLRRAWCPPDLVEGNPVLEIAKHIIFRMRGRMVVERPASKGGDVEFTDFAELSREYRSGRVHPADLKKAVAGALADILRPFREHFASRPELVEVLTAAGEA
jgi:tyrosyl-tRNA synthetase